MTTDPCWTLAVAGQTI